MRKAQIALVGCGGMGRSGHLPVYFELKDPLELVAVCDIDKQRAKGTGEKYGVPHYTDVQRMLEKEKKIDIVDICTPDYTHHAVAKIAAENKKHIIVEKPMAITLPCADIIVKASEKSGVYYEVAEQYYRMPNDRIIMKLIREGIIGDVMRVYVVDSADISSTAWSGVCLDMGVHRMSQLRMCVSSEVKDIVGYTKQFLPTSEEGMYGKISENWGHALVRFLNGSVGICECSAWGEPSPGGAIDYRQVVGTKGTIRDDLWPTKGEGEFSLRAIHKGEMADIPIERITHKVNGKDVLLKIVVHTEPEIVWENPFKEHILNDWEIAMADQLKSIADAALYDKEPEYGSEGRKDVEMCMALYESSLLGMTSVKLPITEITSYEQKVHEAFKSRFGHDPIEA